jgi:ParB family chromosome partitioning protein
MAKLTDTIKTSGLNSGAQVLGKMMRVSEIEEDPEISDMFQVHDDVFQAIQTSMMEKGFDTAQPLVLWKGKRIVVDGRTRLRAAKAAELLEVPVVEREFETLDEAKLYCFKRQAERRNLTQAEIFTVAVELGIKTTHDGKGRGSEILAKDLGVSSTVIQKARTVAKHGSEEDIQAVKNNELTINRAYEKLRKERNAQEDVAPETDTTDTSDIDQVPEKEGGSEEDTGFSIFSGGDIFDGAIETDEKPVEFTVTDAYGIPEKVKFLKSAVILLIESKELPEQSAKLLPIKLLINHFLRTNERNGFYKLLPDKVRSVITQGINSISEGEKEQ